MRRAGGTWSRNAREPGGRLGVRNAAPRGGGGRCLGCTLSAGRGPPRPAPRLPGHGVAGSSQSCAGSWGPLTWRMASPRQGCRVAAPALSTWTLDTPPPARPRSLRTAPGGAPPLRCPPAQLTGGPPSGGGWPSLRNLKVGIHHRQARPRVERGGVQRLGECRGGWGDWRCWGGWGPL